LVLLEGKGDRFREGEIIDLHRIMRDVISSITFCSLKFVCFFFTISQLCVSKECDTAKNITKVAPQEGERDTMPTVVNSKLP
jgi:hypothetical protein